MLIVFDVTERWTWKSGSERIRTRTRRRWHFRTSGSTSTRTRCRSGSASTCTTLISPCRSWAKTLFRVWCSSLFARRSAVLTSQNDGYVTIYRHISTTGSNAKACLWCVGIVQRRQRQLHQRSVGMARKGPRFLGKQCFIQLIPLINAVFKFLTHWALNNYSQ